MKGSKFTHVGPITVGCISPEARDLLDRVMEEYAVFYDEMDLNRRPRATPDDVYSFAYWLIRWSGLVQPAREESS